jgi:hypothetical protein
MRSNLDLINACTASVYLFIFQYRFRNLHETFPQVLFPCFRLQISIVRNVMGVKWWKKKKDFLLLEMVRFNSLRPTKKNPLPCLLADTS